MSTTNILTGTNEWADKTSNIFFGCENACKYCYAKGFHVVRLKKRTFENCTQPILNEKAFNKKPKHTDAITMFPSAHDITEANVEQCVQYLEPRLKLGNKIVIVTKPRLEVIKFMCDRLAPYKDNFLFRFTIQSMSNETLRFWEPSAPSFDERLEALVYASFRGFNTSLSCEPILDDTVSEVVQRLSIYVTHSIWIGLPNRLYPILKTNKVFDEVTAQKAMELEELINSRFPEMLYLMFSTFPKVWFKDSLRKRLGLAPLETSAPDFA